MASSREEVENEIWESERQIYWYERVSVDNDMSSAEVLVILAAIIYSSSQQPLFSITKTTFKGLQGIVPSAQVRSSGLNRAVYYHDQAVAVVDINKNNEISNCDIVEGYEPNEIQDILRNLSKMESPAEVSFSEMTGLMYRCEQLDRMQLNSTTGNDSPKGTLQRANQIGANALKLLSGILPGTKWCGTGDVAEDYHDLGPEADIDRCCRTHDLCPVKIRAQRTRYNLTNYSLYSKSHCTCDSALYHCLKNVAKPTANIMGKLYFNIVKIECVEDIPRNAEMSSGAAKKFSSTGLTF